MSYDHNYYNTVESNYKDVGVISAQKVRSLWYSDVREKCARICE